MTEPALVRRAITLSRRYAECGNHRAARKVWLTATRLAGRCGGISGGSWAGDGYGAIVLDDGLVAVSPVPLVERSPEDAAWWRARL